MRITLISCLCIVLLGIAIFVTQGRHILPSATKSEPQPNTAEASTALITPALRTGRIKLEPSEPGVSEGSGEGGTLVTGQVIDALGVAVGGAIVSLGNLGAGQATSSADGHFELPNRVHSGLGVLRVGGVGLVPAEPSVVVTVTEGEERLELVVRVLRCPSIQGHVWTVTGKAVAGYRIAHDPAIEGRTSTARTDSDGHFILYAPRVSDLPKVKLVPSECGDYGLPRDIPEVSWGERDISITVEHASRVVVEIKREKDGSSVPDYDVYVISSDHHSVSKHGNDPFVVRGGNEQSAISPLLPGKATLFVVPYSPGLARSDAISISVGDADEPVSVPVRIWLRAAPTIQVILKSISGKAIACARIELGDGLAQQPQRNVWDERLLHWGDAKKELILPEAGHPVLSDAAESDANGKAVLTWRRGQGEATLRVAAPGFLPRLVEIPSVQGQILEITLRPFEGIAGTLGPPSLLSFSPSLRVYGLTAVRSEGRPKWVAVDPESGRFELPKTAATRFRVALALQLWGGRRMQVTSSLIVIDKSDFGDGDIKIDGSAWIPGKISGVAYVDGQPAGRLLLMSLTTEGLARGYVSEAVTDRYGNFIFRLVPPGSFAVTASRGPVPLVLGVVRGVLPQSSNMCSFRAETRTLDLLLRGPDGSPLSEGERVRVSCERYPLLRATRAVESGGRLKMDGFTRGATALIHGYSPSVKGLHGAERFGNGSEVTLR